VIIDLNSLRAWVAALLGVGLVGPDERLASRTPERSRLRPGRRRPR
jgi:hypothetical protein